MGRSQEREPGSTEYRKRWTPRFTAAAQDLVLLGAVGWTRPRQSLIKVGFAEGNPRSNRGGSFQLLQCMLTSECNGQARSHPAASPWETSVDDRSPPPFQVSSSLQGRFSHLGTQQGPGSISPRSGGRCTSNFSAARSVLVTRVSSTKSKVLARQSQRTCVLLHTISWASGGLRLSA